MNGSEGRTSIGDGKDRKDRRINKTDKTDGRKDGGPTKGVGAKGRTHLGNGNGKDGQDRNDKRWTDERTGIHAWG